MDKMYCYNYLKDYILEVGHRIVGFDKTILEDNVLSLQWKNLSVISICLVAVPMSLPCRHCLLI